MIGFNETLPAGRLPENDVEGMRQFLDALFTPKPHDNFYAQFYVGTAVIAALAILATAILFQRLRSRSSWLVQLYHTPRGTFVIPNAVMTLVIFLFLFMIFFIPYALLSIGFYRDGKHQKNYHFWRQAPWLLLWIAAFLCSGGTISAFPDALRQRGKKVGTLQRLLLRPSVFHGVLLCTPLLCLATLLVPLVLCVRQFNRMLPLHRDWLAQAAEPSADVAELAASAKEIWLGITKVYYYDGVTFATWFAWGGILFVLFCSVAIHTLLRVRAQVKLAKKKKEALSRTQPTFYLFSSRPNYGRSHDHDEHAEIASPTHGHGMPSAAPVGSATPSTGQQAVKFNAEADRAPQSARRREEESPELIEVMQTETTSVMFPALKIKPNEKLTKVQAAARRSSALNLVYRNLLVQYAAIGCGIGAFSILAMYTAVTSYRTSREVDMGIWHEAGNLLALYITMVFGICVVGAVTWRSFSPSFTLRADAEDVEEEEIELPQTASITQEKSPREQTIHLDDGSDAAGSLQKVDSMRSATTYAPTSREDLPSHKAPQPPAFVGSQPASPRRAALTPPTSPRERVLAALASGTDAAAQPNPNRSRYGTWRDTSPNS